MGKISIYEANLKFIALGSEPVSVAKEHLFMKKYFKTKQQKAFFNYYYIFRDKTNFTNHTGIVITAPTLCKLAGKFEWLLTEYNNAKSEMDLDRLGKLQKRRINLLKKFL